MLENPAVFVASPGDDLLLETAVKLAPLFDARVEHLRNQVFGAEATDLADGMIVEVVHRSVKESGVQVSHGESRLVGPELNAPISTILEKRGNDFKAAISPVLFFDNQGRENGRGRLCNGPYR